MKKSMHQNNGLKAEFFICRSEVGVPTSTWFHLQTPHGGHRVQKKGCFNEGALK